MSWGNRRKALFLFSIVAIVIALIAVTLIAVIYEAPSCMDNKQNQDEQGIDCGGSCRYLCSASLQEPSARFVRQVTPAPGRTDVIAYIDNPNPRAGVSGAKYTITLYDTAGATIATKDGSMDLPPSSTIPLFVPEFTGGYTNIARGFLAFDTTSLKWEYAEPTPTRLAVVNTVSSLGTTPRITADIRNISALPLYSVPIVATVFDAKNNAIAASATVVDVPANGVTPVVFTWSAPFDGIPARTEIIPILRAK